VRNERGEWQDYSGLNPASHRPPQPPGPIGQDPHKEAAQRTHRQVGHTLRRFTWANAWQQLAAVAAEILGPESFGLGVGYGLARSAGQSVLSLFALQKMFVLADVYDLLHGNKSGALRLSPLAAMPGLGALYGATLFLSRFELFGFGLPELEEAHRQRQALLDELTAIFRDPPAFFARLGTAIKQDAIERWRRYQRLLKEPGLRAQFEAGEILGEVLFETAILLLTVLDGVGVAIKLAKEAPELLRVLRTLSAASREGELAGGVGAGRTAAPLEQEAELAQNAPKSVSPGPEPRSATRDKGWESKPGPAADEIPAATRANRSTWRTEPSGERGGEPIGEPTINEPNQPARKKRAIAIENDSARILANKGYNVVQNPKVPGVEKNPDYLIEGNVFDCYAPEEGTPAENIVKAMNRKVGEKQADRIVLNLRDSDVTRYQLRDALNAGAHPDLKEVIVIDQNRNVIRFYP
jgi:hypothetical protein